jgi:hypothetical protein
VITNDVSDYVNLLVRIAHIIRNHTLYVVLERPRRRWEDNIRMNLREIGWEGEDWMHLAQDRDQWRATVCMVTNLLVL